MKKFLTERNLVGLLFILTLVIFSLAQRDADRIDAMNKEKTDFTTITTADSTAALVPGAAHD